MANGSGRAITETIVEDAKPGQFIWDGGNKGVAGLVLRVAPGGAKTWLFRYRNQTGQQRYLKLGRHPAQNVEDARRWAKVQSGAVASGVDPKAAELAKAEAGAEEARNIHTVADIASYLEGTYAKRKELRAATVAMYRSALHRHILPQLGTKRIETVRKVDILALHDGVREQVKTRDGEGSYQANRVLAVARLMFNLAVNDKEWCDRNPCNGVEAFPENKRKRNLSAAEVKRLMAAVADYGSGKHRKPKDSPNLEAPDQAEKDREAADAVQMLLLTGARLQEVLSAEWGHFDMERQIWSKPPSSVKTGIQHDVALSGYAWELVKGMAKQRRHGRFLFPGAARCAEEPSPVEINSGLPTGGSARADLNRPWRTICSMAQLNDIRLHDLRRTLASFMLSQGHSIAAVGSALGHTNPLTTAGYAYLAPDVQRAALKDTGEALMRAAGRMAPVASKGGRKPKGSVVPFPEAAAK